MVKKTIISKRTDRGSEQFLLRLPGGMRERLAKVAEREGHTMNAVIVTALAMYFESKRPPAVSIEYRRSAEIETAIRELAANQQLTLELLKKMIQSPAVSRQADDMADMVDRLDRAIASKK
jgi:hypothetical protein